MGNVVDDGRAQRSDTRGRILDAACDIAKAGDGTRVSVRAVAARAGVGLGTLRHHFPTQGELLNAVLASIYQEALPDERIRDSSAPPKDRLLECLRHILAPVGGSRAGLARCGQACSAPSSTPRRPTAATWATSHSNGRRSGGSSRGCRSSSTKARSPAATTPFGRASS
ncbi:TetR/AcrR family transcriptional regulator [Mycolicibacterium grossiae]|nr:TetR/AcrR family transcriptional regulator [Mycolicibacterium grossiae]